MKVALAQFNALIGDIAGNVSRIREYIALAAEQGAELVAFSELATVGYPPRDLLRDPHLVAENVTAVESLAEDCRDIAALVGFVRPAAEGPGQPLEDAAAVLADGKIQHVHAKALLPNYDVYDDPCYFRAGSGPGCSEIDGYRFGVAICEDFWDPEALGRDLYGVDPIKRLLREGVGAIINIAASGYQRGKVIQREELFSRQARRSSAMVLYVNQVGGNDDMVFDGGSCAVSPTGKLVARAASFREDLLVVDTDADSARCEVLDDELTRLTEALKLGLRDYVSKAGFRGVVLDLTGGLSSAVVAALAADTVGSQRVRALAFSDGDGSDRSLADIRRLAGNLELALEVLPLGPAHTALESLLGRALSNQNAQLPRDEVAGRIRADVVAAYGSACGHLVLASANKTDLALGRSVPAGNLPGALAPIGDVFSRDVLRLARHLNAGAERIPNGLLEAVREFEPGRGHVGREEPPPDESTDEILRRYIELGRTADQIAESGFDGDTVRKTIHQVDRAEYKRKQAPVVLKVTSRAFGPGRRMPVARRYP